MAPWKASLKAICFAVLSVTLATTGAAAEENAPSRWAILATLSGQNQPVADLLVAKLSAGGDFELVDREDVQSASNELALAAIGRSEGTRQRREMGQRLAADMLLVLDEVPLVESSEPSTTERAQANESKVPLSGLRVVICATSVGARLHTQVLIRNGQSTEDMVNRIDEIARQVRKRFAGGVRHVVGVSPFRSEVLTHEFDSYQGGLAHLLESSFSTLPGIAVVEREEAQSIWDEIADQEAPAPNAPVPLIVEGEFRKTTVAGRQEPTLSVTVSSRLPAAPRRRFESSGLALSAIPDWIGSLPPKLLDLRTDNGRSTFAKDEQFRWLIERAHDFSKVGEWYHAMGLRQAALLLEPGNRAERLSLIDDQRSLFRGIVSRKMPMPDWLGPSDETRAAKLLAIYVSQLANQEYLIRNRLVDKTVAAQLISSGPLSLPLGRRAPGEPMTAHQRAFAEAEEAKKEFLWNIAALVFELPDPPETVYGTPRDLGGNLQLALLSQAGERLDGEPLTADDLSFYTKFWTERVPDDLGFGSTVSRIRYQYFPDTDRAYKPLELTHGRRRDRPGLSRDVWAKFLDDLASTNHRTASLTGQIERLIWHWYLVDQQTSAAELTKLRETADEITLKAQKYVEASGTRQSVGLGRSNYSQLFDEVLWQLERLKYVSSPYAERRPLKPEPAKQAPQPVNERKVDANRGGRIRITKLGFPFPVRTYQEYEVRGPVSPALQRSQRRIPGEGFYGEARWVSWPGYADIVWTPLEIYWMRQPGEFEKMKLAGAENTVFDDVCADGNRLWVSTLASGIWVIDPDGRVVAHVDEKVGLPPAEHGLRLLPIGGGRACVAGSFGQNARGWCAIVDISGTKPNVNVFHEARLVNNWQAVAQKQKAEFHNNPENDLKQAFRPHCLVAHTTRDGRKQVYVFRARPGVSSNERPLVIDVDSLQVSLGDSPGRFQGVSEARPERYLSHDGELLHISWLQKFQPAAVARFVPYFSPYDVASSQGFIELGDHFDIPARRGWFRFDRKTETYENIFGRGERWPYPHQDMVFARSVHYGIVGWALLALSVHNSMYQVVVDEDPAAGPRAVQAPQNTISELQRSRIPSDREFPLSEEEKQRLIKSIQQLLEHAPKVPDDALVLYEGHPEFIDNWLPGLHVHDGWLDPPAKKEGYRFFYVDGRVALVETLDSGPESKSYKIWHGSHGEPLLVKQTVKRQLPRGRMTRDPKTGRFPDRLPEDIHLPPVYQDQFSYAAALYDDRGLLSRVVQVDENLRSQRMTVYEHTDGYQSAAIHECNAAGLCRYTRYESAVDANGEPIPPGSNTPSVYSRRFEKVAEPHRIGLAPYYPIPGFVQ